MCGCTSVCVFFYCICDHLSLSHVHGKHGRIRRQRQKEQTISSGSPADAEVHSVLKKYTVGAFRKSNNEKRFDRGMHPNGTWKMAGQWKSNGRARASTASKYAWRHGNEDDSNNAVMAWVKMGKIK
uniref:uncharacterized protein LOC120958353 isoform X1 n=1 Tax=Anopheles coluzzii TaxID=1518534 RepID=UPI0020FF9682|nr:uncharacterized protein LOC120958353 isoform X1 [Anopheles coluzzii]